MEILFPGIRRSSLLQVNRSRSADAGKTNSTPPVFSDNALLPPDSPPTPKNEYSAQASFAEQLFANHRNAYFERLGYLLNILMQIPNHFFPAKGIFSFSGSDETDILRQISGCFFCIPLLEPASA